jgi:threonine dehydrogenase-like Zn-dependent dehydrogenase
MAAEVFSSFVNRQRTSLDDAATGFEIFDRKQDECLKVVPKTAP